MVSGGVTYTRGGSFELDKDGFIVSKNGKFLQGFGLDSQGNQLPIGNLQVSEKESPPKSTESIDLSFNIDSRADASTLQQPYNKDESGSFTYSSTIRTFDSLGNEHTIKYNLVEQPPIREVQALAFAKANTADYQYNSSVDISGTPVNLLTLQKMIDLPAGAGDVGQVRAVRLDAGTADADTITVGMTIGGFNYTATVDNGNTAGVAPGVNYDTAGELAALFDGALEADIVSKYNASIPDTDTDTPRLLGVARDPSDPAGQQLLFQFDDRGSAPAVGSFLAGTAPGAAVAQSNLIGTEWEPQDAAGNPTGAVTTNTINVGGAVSALTTADPRIAKIEFAESDDGSAFEVQLRFRADATDVDPVQVRNSTDKSLRTDVDISSTSLDANEVHTYSFNDAAFNGGVLAARTNIKIGSVDIPLTQGASPASINETIVSFQQVILDSNPDLESVTFNSSNELVLTFKAEVGDLNNDTGLLVSMGDADGDPANGTEVPVLQRTGLVNGDSSYNGVYRLYAYLNGSELLDIGKDVDPGESGFLGFGDASNPSEPGPVTIKFNSTNGLLSEINGTTIAPNADAPKLTVAGADPANPATTIALDLTGTTQFASASIVKTSSQDGYTKGDLIGVSFSESGEMVASFSNGQNRSLGVVAMGTFENQSGLAAVGDTEWTATLTSGAATLNPPGTGLNGSLRSAALEQSNVDLSEELVRLIEAQRNFQANSKTLETLNTVTQNILQI